MNRTLYHFFDKVFLLQFYDVVLYLGHGVSFDIIRQRKLSFLKDF